ncbi:MAG TPA: helix-turn-helix transcriptional regulator [Magnetospirillum sp.]|nr:helix-turn-helix transcriptional regulator [Magnetospirillum sp.]
MSALILATWDMAAAQAVEARVPPDGCRDLILSMAPGERPTWFVSTLPEQTYGVAVEAGTILRGFRLRPGTMVDEAALVASVQGRPWDDDEVASRLDDFCRLPTTVSEALAALATECATVAQAAALLGVGPRTLQRLLLAATGRPPSYWLLLARARRSARDVLAAGALAEIADAHGYADQAHMSREFRRWFGTTPLKLRRDAQLAALLTEPGYG